MNSVKTLLKLELKARFGSLDFKSASSIVRTIAVFAFAALVYAIYIIITQSIAEMFFYYDMGFEFLVLFITVMQVLLLFISISSAIKTLYYQGDNELLLRFPVSGSAVFFSKILMMLIYQVIGTLIFLLPPLISYGIVANMAAGYFVSILLVIIMTVALPFMLANILSIPTMYISSFMRNKHLLTLLVSVVLVAGGFAIYMGLIESLMRFWQQESISFFSDSSLAQIRKATAILVPFRQLANIMVGRDVAASFGILLAFMVVLFVGAVAVVRKLYMHTVLSNIEISGSSFVKKTKNKPKTVFHTILYREFLDIFRSNNYSFQYLSMAIAAPIMVYFCNDLAMLVGANSISSTIMPALCLLVMMIFTSVILSFSASCVSRESGNFYLTKTAPVNFRTQVSVKMVLYLIVSLSSIIVSCVLIMATKQVSVAVGFSIMLITSLYAIGMTCFSIRLDIAKPQFPVGGDGELSSGSVATFVSMTVGLILSGLCGIGGTVGIFMWQGSLRTIERATTATFLTIGAIILVLTIASVVWLFVGLEKKYYKISQR